MVNRLRRRLLGFFATAVAVGVTAPVFGTPITRQDETLSGDLGRALFPYADFSRPEIARLFDAIMMDVRREFGPSAFLLKRLARYCEVNRRAGHSGPKSVELAIAKILTRNAVGPQMDLMIDRIYARGVHHTVLITPAFPQGPIYFGQLDPYMRDYDRPPQKSRGARTTLSGNG